MESVFVVCTSHRAFDKLKSLLGYHPQSYYNLIENKNYQLTEINLNELDEALKIKGIRKGKFNKNWHKCISFT